jgi:PAS domain S-box-containing protein
MNSSFTTNDREMAPWLEAILSDYQDAVIITDRNFERLHWNVAAEELWFQQSNRPSGNNIIDFLEMLFPGHAEMLTLLQKAIAQDEPEEDIFLDTSDGRSFRLSCYTHKFPGTNYLLDVVLILRDLRVSFRIEKEQQPDVQLYRNLLNMLDEGVLLVQGDQGTVISVNDKACSITGMMRDQLIGVRCKDLAGKVMKEDGTGMKIHEFPPVVTLRTGKAVQGAVVGYKKSSGDTVWLSVNACIPDENMPYLMAISFTDITDQREVKARLTETEAIFRSFMNNTHSPAWILDETGSIIYMNDLFKDVWKLSDSNLHGNIHDLLPREMVDEYVANNRKVLETGMPLITIENSLRADGTPGVYLVYKFLLQTSQTTRLIGGQSIDITDQKMAQEEIIKSNERFYYATKATSDSIWDWNIEKGHIYRSEPFTRLTGYTQNEMENNLYWWFDKIHPADRERVKQNINDCLLSHNNYWQAEYRFRCSDGSYKYLSDKGYIIFRNGEAVRAIGAIQDLTATRQLEDELACQKEKERIQVNQAMIAGQDFERNEISKELHDNVNQILSSAILLLSVSKSNPEEQGHLIEKTGEYLNLAIQEIRKITKSLSTSVVKEVGLIEPIEDIVNNIQLLTDMEVEFDYDPMIEQQLSQDMQLMLYRIIQEQTSNITRYAEARNILISIHKNAGLLTLLIHDNGKGFDLNKQSKGIGLMNIRNRAETFGGSVHIVTKPGEGCRLEVKIPVGN